MNKTALIFSTVALILAISSCKKNEPVTPTGASVTNRLKENAACNTPPVFYGVKTFGGILRDEGRVIDFDASGNLIVKGTYQQTVDFDPGPGTAYLDGPGGWPNVGKKGMFSAKYTRLGKFISVQHLGDYVEETRIVDNKGNVYSYGYEGPNLELGSGVPVNVMVYKHSGSGTLLGKIKIGSIYFTYENWTAMCVIKPDNKGNIFIATEMGKIFKFTDAGKLIWELDQPNYGRGKFEFDNFGNIYYIGDAYYFASGSYYVVKIGTAGNLLWKVKRENNDQITSEVFTSDSQGNTYIAGGFAHNTDFDPGPGEYMMESGQVAKYTYRDNTQYIRKLDANGNFIWAVRFALGGAYPETSNIRLGAIKLDPTETYICVTGNFNGPTLFDLANPATQIRGHEVPDVFMLSFKQCK